MKKSNFDYLVPKFHQNEKNETPKLARICDMSLPCTKNVSKLEDQNKWKINQHFNVFDK